MMHLEKYSASGNDFLIFHTFVKKDYSALAKKVCHRQEGIGADGLIVLLPHSEYDLEWLFYNSDGSEATMCGNGTRAAGLYAYLNGLSDSSLKLLSGAGVIELDVDGDQVGSSLGEEKVLERGIEHEGITWWLIDTGVPHLVGEVSDLSLFDDSLSTLLRKKYNANVNWYVCQNGELQVRTFERGVEGETLACGTGMAAVFARTFQESKVTSPCTVVPKSGEKLRFEKRGSSLFFKGSVNKICDTIPDLKFDAF